MILLRHAVFRRRASAGFSFGADHHSPTLIGKQPDSTGKNREHYLLARNNKEFRKRISELDLIHLQGFKILESK
jgi:hypothetical protein